MAVPQAVLVNAVAEGITGAQDTLQPGFSSVQINLDANGNPILEYDATPGRHYELQGSNDLVTWVPLSQGLADSATMRVPIDQSEPQMRFYRVRPVVSESMLEFQPSSSRPAMRASGTAQGYAEAFTGPEPTTSIHPMEDTERPGSDLVGTLPGTVSVDHSGSASYAIPITPPPGVGGLAPSLSLSYSSRAGNGILGVGWSLSGLSAITRGPSGWEPDGFLNGVDFDENDRLFLDGQRLIEITRRNGNQGQEIEFRTEIETFSRIVGYGTQGKSPKFFRVWTKDGHEAEYGVTENSRAEAQGKQDVLLWAVNEIKDRAGNFIHFSYQELNDTGEHYPSEIRYGGNSSAQTSNFASIKFSYEPADRPDPSFARVGGSIVKLGRRLRALETYVDGELVLRYRFGYELGNATGRSRLATVRVCDPAGDCLPETEFAYTDAPGPAIFDISQTFRLPTDYDVSDNNYLFLTGDFDGDGRTDLLHPYTDVAYALFLAKGNGRFSGPDRVPLTNGKNESYQFVTGDFNADGKTDFFHPRNSQYAELWTPGSNGRFAIKNIAPVGYNVIKGGGSAAPRYYAGDFNGDGATDLLHVVGEKDEMNVPGWKVNVWLSRRNGSFSIVKFPTTKYDITHNDDNYFPVDLNGDGATDLVHFNTGDAYHVWLSKGDGTFEIIKVNSAEAYDLRANDSNFQSGDFNGDGKSDFIHFYDENTIKVWINRGDLGFRILTIESAQLAAYANSRFPFIGEARSHYAFKNTDFNGDGRTDFLHIYDKTHAFAWVSRGDGTFDVKAFVVSYPFAEEKAQFNYQLGDFDGNGRADLIHFVNSNEMRTWLADGEYPDLLKRVENGLESETSISYAPLTSPAVYSKGSASRYPYQTIRGPLHVVAKVRRGDGVGGLYDMSYRYTAARVHLRGRGFVGFEQMDETDNETGITTRTTFKHEFPLIGQIARKQTLQPNGARISDTANTWKWRRAISSAGVYFPYLAVATTTEYELTKRKIGSRKTSLVFDDFGNPLKTTIVKSVAQHAATGGAKSGSHRVTTVVVNAYDQNISNSRWQLDLLRRGVVTGNSTDDRTVGEVEDRVVAFEYYPNGQIKEEIVEPDASQARFRLRTDYEYDTFGNRKRRTVSGPDIEARVSRTEHDGRGRFPVKSVNDIGQTELRNYDTRFGGLVKLTSPNNLAEEWEYDSFGRLVKQKRPDGTFTTTRELSPDSDRPSGAAYMVRTKNLGESPETAYVDTLGRTIRTKSRGFDGAKIFSDTEFDGKGRLARASRPYFEGSSPFWTQFTYDILGRVKTEATQESEDSAKRATTKYTYLGRETLEENARGHKSAQIRNSLGALGLLVEDPGPKSQRITSHVYDAYGNLRITTDHAGNRTVNLYDVRGRKREMRDPDMGKWQYEYNSVSELTSQTDNKNQSVTTHFDSLGRLKLRVEKEGETHLYYDTAPGKGIGKLHRVEGPGGYVCVHTYDELGRPDSTTISFSGTTSVVRNRYDNLGRPELLYYPGPGLITRSVWNERGFLQEIRNARTEKAYWTANAVNAAGQTTAESFGNGLRSNSRFDGARGWLRELQTGVNGSVQSFNYRYNAIGGLRERRNNVDGLVELFAYDSANRLTEAELRGSTTFKKAYEYDLIGNLIRKSGVGTYNYSGPGAGPHAVKAVAGTMNTTFRYDRNGNMTEGNGRTITYTSYNKPETITRGAQQVSFSYGPDYERLTQVSTEDGSSTTTFYVSNIYEDVRRPDATEQRHYVYAGPELVSLVTSEVRATGPPVAQTRFVHLDHLGSIESITDEGARVEERFSYDPHGKRRLPNGLDAPSGSITSPTTQHAFTGHLQLDALDLIHMGGRGYDPLLGRFTSPDPFVQSIANSQALNRYSYVLNDPLSYTDPSGYFFKSLSRFLPSSGREWGALAAGIAVSAAVGPYAGAYAAAALGGAASGAIASKGDFKATLLSAATAVAMHGITDAASTSLQGGEVPNGLGPEGPGSMIDYDCRGGICGDYDFSTDPPVAVPQSKPQIRIRWDPSLSRGLQKAASDFRLLLGSFRLGGYIAAGLRGGGGGAWVAAANEADNLQAGVFGGQTGKFQLGYTIAGEYGGYAVEYVGDAAAGRIGSGGTRLNVSQQIAAKRPPLSAYKRALGEVHEEVGRMPKGKPGKWGSPQAGTSTKGYRLDPAHPRASPESPESKLHINWWDWTEGGKGTGGRRGAVPIGD